MSRHWLIPQAKRPKVYMEHPVMSGDEIRRRTQAVWDQFYSLPSIWRRAGGAVTSLKARLAFLLISKIYRQMYANTGIATDSARVQRSARWARLLAIPCRRLFAGELMPDLVVASIDGASGPTGRRLAVIDERLHHHTPGPGGARA